MNLSLSTRVPLSIDTVLAALPDAPVMSTRDRDWEGVTLDMFGSMPKFAFHALAHDHHLIVYCPSGRVRLMQSRAGRTHESMFSAGMSLILPAGYDSMWDGDAAASARIRVPPKLIEQAAEQAGRTTVNAFELRNVFETRDVTLERLAQMLISELERSPHPAQRLIADSVSCALAAHLLRSYNAFEFPEVNTAHVLGPRMLSRLTEFIESRLDSPIGLDELADLARISKFHFTRVFKRSTGMTPIFFVEQCRIQRAKVLLEEGALTLAEVALRTGFADQSHFTRRFHRHVGCTPGAFAREFGRTRRAVKP